MILRELTNNDMAIRFDNIPEDRRWDVCLQKLSTGTEYTLSIRDVCKFLKCDRNWIQRYVRPYIHYIYLSNGFSGISRANFVEIAALALQKPIKESVWLNAYEFEQLIRQSLCNCSRQTINVPLELLLDESKIQFYHNQYRELEEQKISYFQSRNYLQISKIKKKQKHLLESCLSDSIGKQIYSVLPSASKRTNTEAIPCELPPTLELSEMIAAHDLKGYGDSDEEIYRRIFNMGCYRVELQIPDKDGVFSNKVYYIQDPVEEEKLKYPNSIGNILIGYREYIKFFADT